MPEAVELSLATPADAAAAVAVIHAAFDARPPVEPPSTADAETPATVAARIAEGAGVLAWVGDRAVGVVLLADEDDPADPRSRPTTLQRVSVHPDFQHRGIAAQMVTAALDLALQRGARRVRLFAREEFPALIAWWVRRGFEPIADAPHGVVLEHRLPILLEVPTAAAMQRLGAVLADQLAAGDVIVASGPLGAGKTTFAQGLGRGLGVTEAVISPTFVLSRIHPSTTGRPGLVHVDAYRLSDAAELDDLDLAGAGSDVVTLVEWGEGIAEQLSDERLHLTIERRGDDSRLVRLEPFGHRLSAIDPAPLLAAVADRSDDTVGDCSDDTVGDRSDSRLPATGTGRPA